MDVYDLIVIGAGSGLDVANAVADSEKSVAIIEKDKMGGTCLNRGCIPSKMLIHSADIVDSIKSADTFGVNVQSYSVDLKKMVNRVTNIVDDDAKSIRDALRNSQNPRLFEGSCRFVGEKTLEVNGQQIKGRKILIACGSRPNVPEINGLADVHFMTSDDALRLEKQPDALTVVGGGYVACELAHFFGSLGTTINIIHRHENLIPNEDHEIAEQFTKIFSKKYNVYLNSEPTRINEKNGKILVQIKDAAGKIVELQSDEILIATGRRPNSDTLDLERTGVEVDKKGHIKTDGHLETTKKGIFALGDVIGKYPFKHSANYEAKYAFHNILNDEMKEIDYSVMPHAIFSSPRVASVGLTEKELQEKKISYEKNNYPFNRTGMGMALEDNDGLVKVLASEDGRKILGCHIMGTNAPTLIHEVIVAMNASADSTIPIRKSVHIHPALSEVISRAISGIPTH